MITLVGDTYFMSSVLDRSFTAVNARAQLSYQFSQSVLSGTLDVKVNVPLVIRGRRPGNSVGIMSLYAGPDKWHVLVGTPTNRIEVKLLETLDMNAYLMMGSQIPAPATPPANVMTAFNYVPQRSPGINSGSGIAFGASMHTAFGEPFGPFTCKLGVDVGFDLNLLNVGGANCDGLSAGTKPGINGWYASGQIYGYFAGSVGIIVDFMGNPAEYKIFDVTAAALMEGGFPNPYWYKGQIRGSYNILNGLITGTCTYKIEEGSRCAPPPENPLAGIKMINAVLPVTGATNIDPAIIPSAAFNVDINSEMNVLKLRADGTSETQRVRFVVEHYTLKKGSASVSTNIAYTSDNARANLNIINALLDPNSTYTISLKIAAQLRSGTSWIQLTRANGSAITEELNYSFTTGPLPDKITASMVSYCIPFDRQRNFPQNTCDIGFVQTRQNISAIFLQPRSGYTRKYFARFMPVNGGSIIETDAFPYDANARRMNFTIPTLNKSTIYRMQIIHRDIRNATSTGTFGGVSPVFVPALSVNFQNMLSNSLSLRLRGLEDAMALSGNEHLYYEYYFRTSQYDTYNEKVAAIQTRDPEFVDLNANSPTNPLEFALLKFYIPEKFEQFDLRGFNIINSAGSQVLMRNFNVLDAAQSSWHTGFATPVIYNLYSRIRSNNYNSRSLIRETPDLYGIPAYSIIYTSGLSSPLSDGEVGLPVTPSTPPSTFTLVGGSSTNLVGTTGNNLSLGALNSGPPAANMSFELETAYFAKQDYDRVALMIAEMRTRFGSTLSGVDATTKSMISNFQNTPFRKLSTNSSVLSATLTYNAINCSNGTSTFSVTRSFGQAPLNLFTPIFIK
jgi:hypothetical protein